MAFDYKKEYKEFYLPPKTPDYFPYVVPPLEGLCVQCMHIESYDNEASTIRGMEIYAKTMVTNRT